MCKFLVDEGAPVDFIEPNLYLMEFGERGLMYAFTVIHADTLTSLSPSCTMFPSIDCIVDGTEELQRIMDCRQTLLEKGADPLLSTQHQPSLWMRLLMCGTTVCLNVPIVSSEMSL